VKGRPKASEERQFTGSDQGLDGQQGRFSQKLSVTRDHADIAALADLCVERFLHVIDLRKAHGPEFVVRQLVGLGLEVLGWMSGRRITLFRQIKMISVTYDYSTKGNQD
jgi:hypothetical protein